VRIDRFLHCIRLVKSRTLARSVIEAGHVRIDGKRIERPSEPVRAGSVIALPLHGRTRVLRILALPGRRGPAAEARACYEELSGASSVSPATLRLSAATPAVGRRMRR
jgi:ribosome-associated heat shock protein Hsp15